MKRVWRLLIPMLVVLIGCESTDTEDDGPCVVGETRCDGAMIQQCVNEIWNDYDDCAITSQTCGLRQGESVCYTPVNTDAAGESGSNGNDTTAAGGPSDGSQSTDSQSQVTADTDANSSGNGSNDTERATDSENVSSTGGGGTVDVNNESADRDTYSD